MKIITQFKIMYQTRKRVEPMKILLLLLPLLFLGADFPIKYPKETLNMSKIEFFNWATDQNKQAKEAWTKEFNKDYQYNYGSKQIETTETSGSSSGTSVISPLSISQSPGKSYSTTTKTKSFVPYRYKNPDFRHPGPLTIINPYVKSKKSWTR